MSESERSFYPNRTVCAILEDMRTAHKVANYSYLPGLIEELQFYANRMEMALCDKQDLVEIAKERSAKKRELLDLREEVRKLEEKLGK